ncbi:MAG: primosomal protein N' [Rhodocyclaceae bacterium]
MGSPAVPTIARIALDVPLQGLFDYLGGDAGEEDVGRLVRVEFGRRCLTGVLIEFAETSELDPAKIKPIASIRRDVPALPRSWLELLRFCSDYYRFPLGAAIACALPPGLKHGRSLGRRKSDALFQITPAGRSAIGGLRTRSVARRVLECLAEMESQPMSALRAVSPQAGPVVAELVGSGLIEPVWAESARSPTLLPEQAAAVDAVTKRLGGFAPFLLHGITGSGKTEVYLQLVQQVLERGGQVLMLVPEIALTPQLEGRVAARFPKANLVSLHSGLADGARSRGYLSALWGEADIVLGTRLAVFTPLPRLKLILVDEEHDPSFKQQEGMRYSARDLAIYRAKLESVPIVLGSATPSLESYHHAVSGRYRLLVLSQRAAAASALPRLRCIDTRRIKLDQGLSPGLLDALQQCLGRGEQSLVFLNRRGFAPVLACPACGWVSRCRHCAANQVLHLADRRLRCHHCGAESSVPAVCPDCGNQDLHPFGRGTQRVEAFLRERFPAARVLRVDRDTANTPSRWHAILDAIQEGSVDILVGTQMLAKGHDFPRLTLVGVLSADASLFAADFRAPERLFSQLMQVGGRSGRGALPGEVVIQTEYPEHPLFAALADHDFDRFAQAQLVERRQAGFPPFTFQALLAADAPAMADALAFLRAAADAALRLAGDQVHVFDPIPMRLPRRADRERAQLLVESAQRPVLQGFLKEWSCALQALRPARAVRWHLDIDPLEF